MKRVKVLTWKELYARGSLLSERTIIPPRGFEINFTKQMQDELPTNRIITITINAYGKGVWNNYLGNVWGIETWMVKGWNRPHFC